MSNTIEQLLVQASAAAEAKQLEGAATLLDQVLAQDANNLRALDLFGFVRFFQNRFSEAEQYCRRALVIKPNHAYALKGLGLCLAKQGKLEEGITSLERAIGNAPGWFDPYWDLAIVLNDAGRYEQAVGVLERGQRMVPDKRSELASFAARISSQAAAARRNSAKA